MKIPQDQSETFSKQSTSLKHSVDFNSVQGEQSPRNSLYQPHNKQSNNSSKNIPNHYFTKSCIFNTLVIGFIILFLVMQLNFRSQQLIQQDDNEDQVDSESDASQVAESQIKITKADNNLSIAPNPMPLSNMKKIEQARQKQQEQKRKKQQQAKQKKLKEQKEAQQRKQRQQKQAFSKECTELNKDFKKKFFFIYLDKQEMTKQQAEKFHNLNEKICHFHILYEVDYDYIVDMWNFREQTITQKKQYIDKTKIAKQDKKMLFVFLQQYFWGGLYIHASLGLKFEKIVSQKFISKVRTGKQVMFGQGDHVNNNGVLVPKKNSRAIRTEQKFSEILQKMIRKIIFGQNWLDVCQNYQCTIMSKAIQSK